MAGMDAASVDAVCTDPPYGLSFMGKEWDDLGGIAGSQQLSPAMLAAKGQNGYFQGRGAARPAPPASMQEWHETWAREAFRVLKPGGHLLAFGGTRTFHRLTVAIEDAGFEIRDCLSYLYGSGFPKSHNLSGDWDGWGTALKPAWEPIIVARKPLCGTVAANVTAYGTGALNVDGCRIGDNAGWSYPNGRGGEGWHGRESLGNNLDVPMHATAGRWPANVALDADAAAMLDAVVGERGGGYGSRGQLNGGATKWGFDGHGQTVGYGDTGGPSRFYYTAKASRSERNAGLETPSIHPTVKPISLMRWLVRLVTPPGGVVLDPFMGSGSTGCAAALEGFDFIGIEQSEEYVAIAERRIAYWTRQRPTATQPMLDLVTAAD